MTMTDLEEQNFRKKQLEFHLTDKECDNVIENLKQFFSFSDSQTEFVEYVLNFLEEKQIETDHEKIVEKHNRWKKARGEK